MQVRSKVARRARSSRCATGDARRCHRTGAGREGRPAHRRPSRRGLRRARAGIKVDGVHVGQSDIPVESAASFWAPMPSWDFRPVRGDARVREDRRHEPSTTWASVLCMKRRPRETADAQPTAPSSRKSFEDLRALASQAPCPSWSAAASRRQTCRSSRPPASKASLSVSAVCSADDPHAAAKELVDTWQQA